MSRPALPSVTPEEYYKEQLRLYHSIRPGVEVVIKHSRRYGRGIVENTVPPSRRRWSPGMAYVRTGEGSRFTPGGYWYDLDSLAVCN